MNIPEDIRSAIEVLNFLFTVYKYRREHSKPDSDEPDPTALKEVITELETQAETQPTEASVSARIDAKFSPKHAEKVKQDLSVVRVLTNPPDLSKRDYWAILTQYATALQAIALRYEVFSIHGTRAYNSRHIPLFRTSEVLYPISLAESSATLERRGSPSSVNVYGWMSEEREKEFPITIGLNPTWEGGFSESAIAEDAHFRLDVGSDRNWVVFRRISGSSFIRDTQRRLYAEDVRNIMAAMKQDIFGFLQEMEEETSTLDAIHAELADILAKVPKPPD